MKKLFKINLQNSEVLKKEEMKKLVGGSFPCTCDGHTVYVETIEACCTACGISC
jgi:natural product precursor